MLSPYSRGVPIVTSLNVRQAFFPYGMARNQDGSWTLFNRMYKPVGVVSEDWADWDDPGHKLKIKGLSAAKLAKLDVHELGTGNQIYFYNDEFNPEASASNLNLYLKKLAVLIGLQAVS